MILKERTMTDLENRAAFKAWFKKEYLGIDILANQGDEGAITRRDYAYVGWQAAKAQAEPETQQSQQDVIDSLILQVAEMKSRLNDNYTAGQTSMYLTQQAVIDKLKAQLKAAHDSRVEFVEYCRVIEAQGNKG